MQTLLTNFVELPVEQKTAIASIFVAVFALLFDFLIGKYAWLEFFRQYQEVWALALATAFTAWLESALPSDYGEISIKLVALFIAVALYLLSRTLLKRRGVTEYM